MDKQELLDLLRTELPRLLRDDSDFRAQVIGVLAETMGTKAEFNILLLELKEIREDFQSMRADFEKRFELVEKRFERIDGRFEHVDSVLEQVHRRLNELAIGMGSLGSRTGKALEDVIRQVMESYSGIEKLKAEKLILEDTEGEVFGIKGAIEFDAYVFNGRRFLVEVKSYTDENDVLSFYRKAMFAEKKLGKVEKVIITPAIDKSALKRCKELGIQVHAFSIID